MPGTDGGIPGKKTLTRREFLQLDRFEKIFNPTFPLDGAGIALQSRLNRLHDNKPHIINPVVPQSLAQESTFSLTTPTPEAQGIGTVTNLLPTLGVDEELVHILSLISKRIVAPIAFGLSGGYAGFQVGVALANKSLESTPPPSVGSGQKDKVKKKSRYTRREFILGGLGAVTGAGLSEALLACGSLTPDGQNFSNYDGPDYQRTSLVNQPLSETVSPPDIQRAPHATELIAELQRAVEIAKPDVSLYRTFVDYNYTKNRQTGSEFEMAFVKIGSQTDHLIVNGQERLLDEDIYMVSYIGPEGKPIARVAIWSEIPDQAGAKAFGLHLADENILPNFSKPLLQYVKKDNEDKVRIGFFNTKTYELNDIASFTLKGSDEFSFLKALSIIFNPFEVQSVEAAGLISTATPAGTTIPTVIATATATVILEPTRAASPVPMIEVGGLQIPDPKASNPELFDITNPDSPIVQFANAFGVKPEEVGNLTPQLETGIDGKQFVVLTTGDLAGTATFDESGTPLLIAEQGENGEWGWSEATTRKIADLTGRKVVSYSFWQKLDDEEYVNFYLNNFNEMRIGDELKYNNIFNDNFNWRNVLDDWENVINQLNSGSMPYENEVFNQTWVNRVDSLIQLADENNMQIIGQAFFWLHDIPLYLYSDEYTANEKSRILEFMVKAKMIKFGEVDNWIAFSEMGAAELWAPDNFKTLYNQLGGRELLVDIIKWAREINPQIKLIAVEDHLFDANNDATRQSTNGFNQILNYLEQKGVRPEFVESEDNLWTYAPPNPTDVQQIIQMYQSKGYEIYPAEMTISTLPQYPLWSDRPKTLTNPLTQLELFKLMAEIYINSGTGLGLFSGTDNITWIHEIGATQEKPELFADQNYQPKPSMYLFRAILFELLKNQSP